MKIISAYEKKASIHFSPIVKSKLKSDIRMFVAIKKRKDKRQTSNIENLLNPRFNIASKLVINCDSKEEYARCAESVIIYDLSYEDEIEGIIKSLGLFYTDISYLSLKKDLIQHLYNNGEIDEELCYELIRKHEAPKIRY